MGIKLTQPQFEFFLSWIEGELGKISWKPRVEIKCQGVADSIELNNLHVVLRLPRLVQLHLQLCWAGWVSLIFNHSSHPHPPRNVYFSAEARLVQGVPQNSLGFSFCKFSAHNAPRICHVFQQPFPLAVEKLLKIENYLTKLWSIYSEISHKIQNIVSFKNTPNCFAYISATKYRSEAVLYSKRPAG